MKFNPKSNLKLKKILIIEFWNCNPHLETALEIAKRHVDVGDSVEFYFCGHDTLYKEGISVTPEDCGLFRKLPEVIGAKLISSNNLNFYPRVNLQPVDFNIPEKFVNLKDLMSLKYKTFEVGQSVCSSLVSNLRNSQPDLEKNHETIRNMILSAIQIYEFTRIVIEKQSPDIVYLFNGRFCNHRAVMRASLDAGKEILIHERGASRNKYDVQPFMPHDVMKWQKNILKTWSEVSDDPNAFLLGTKFYTERRQGLEQSWMSFTDHQKRNLLPKVDQTKKIITYFSSSDDEFVSVGDIFQFITWENQYQAVIDLIKICKNNPNIQLFIRLHPHLRDKSREDQLRWLALGQIAGINIVSFDSEVDTYALIERSDIVVTAGSTVGIEAVYWGKPSITLGPSYYSELNVTHYPMSTTELEAMINSNNLSVERDLTIPFGYYMNTFGEAYKYYESETLFNGKFLGVDLHKVTNTRQRWLRCKHFLTKPYRLVLRLIRRLSQTKYKL